MKYYFCISVIGSLAINYYFGKFLLGKTLNMIIIMKDYIPIVLVILLTFGIFFNQTFIEVKWNHSSLQMSIPWLANK